MNNNSSCTSRHTYSFSESDWLEVGIMVGIVTSSPGSAGPTCKINTRITLASSELRTLMKIIAQDELYTQKYINNMGLNQI